MPSLGLKACPIKESKSRIAFFTFNSRIECIVYKREKYMFSFFEYLVFFTKINTFSDI